MSGCYARRARERDGIVANIAEAVRYISSFCAKETKGLDGFDVFEQPPEITSLLNCLGFDTIKVSRRISAGCRVAWSN